ncbi:hypothetical protein C8J57DRAFT_1227123 [Mycena rebaudengoi]|nr:hypothetical protein C8J57DRAFT_1227123 [Mycena rebaudengoi]
MPACGGASLTGLPAPFVAPLSAKLQSATMPSRPNFLRPSTRALSKGLRTTLRSPFMTGTASFSLQTTGTSRLTITRHMYFLVDRVKHTLLSPNPSRFFPIPRCPFRTMSFDRFDDHQLRKLYKHLKDFPTQALASVQVGVHAGADDTFNSSQSLPGNAFTFCKGPEFKDPFLATVFGIVKSTAEMDGYVAVTLVQPFIPDEDSELQELRSLFNAQALTLDALVDLDESHGLGWHWRRGGYYSVECWTGHPAYNGTRVTSATPPLEIYMRLDSQFPMPYEGQMLNYICEFTVLDGSLRADAMTAAIAICSGRSGEYWGLKTTLPSHGATLHDAVQLLKAVQYGPSVQSVLEHMSARQLVLAGASQPLVFSHVSRFVREKGEAACAIPEPRTGDSHFGRLPLDMATLILTEYLDHICERVPFSATSTRNRALAALVLQQQVARQLGRYNLDCRAAAARYGE